MSAFVCTLPRPPSVNVHTFNAPGKGRGKTKAYKTWRDEAGWELLLAKPPRGIEEYTLTLEFARRGDLDNLAKAINDLLQAHGVVRNDSGCVELHMYWCDDVEQNRCRLHLVQVDKEALTGSSAKQEA